jgi:hypothetical protein
MFKKGHPGRQCRFTRAQAVSLGQLDQMQLEFVAQLHGRLQAIPQFKAPHRLAALCRRGEQVEVVQMDADRRLPTKSFLGSRRGVMAASQVSLSFILAGGQEDMGKSKGYLPGQVLIAFEFNVIRAVER